MTRVSYEQVLKIAQELDATGVSPTVAAVCSRTGGRRDYVHLHLKARRSSTLQGGENQ